MSTRLPGIEMSVEEEGDDEHHISSGNDQRRTLLPLPSTTQGVSSSSLSPAGAVVAATAAATASRGSCNDPQTSASPPSLTPPPHAGAGGGRAAASSRGSYSPLKHFAVSEMYYGSTKKDSTHTQRHYHEHEYKKGLAVRFGGEDDENNTNNDHGIKLESIGFRSNEHQKGEGGREMAVDAVAATKIWFYLSSCCSRKDSRGGGGKQGRGRWGCIRMPSLRRLALLLSLNFNILITVVKLVAYLQSFSLSVLAALLDSVLDILSQLVLNYTEKHSALQRSSAHYPAGASRLEPIGVLTCAALMGMASFEVLKESFVSLLYQTSPLASELSLISFYNMLAIIFAKLLLLYLCNRAARRKVLVRTGQSEGSIGSSRMMDDYDDEEGEEEYDGPEGEFTGEYEYDDASSSIADTLLTQESPLFRPNAGTAATAAAGAAAAHTAGGGGGGVFSGSARAPKAPPPSSSTAKAVVQLADPTLEAVAQDHFNDILSNSVAAVALLLALRNPSLWYLDPVGAILISLYIIYSWYQTGREQIEHLTGRSAPADFIDELKELAHNFDDRMQVDTVRAYHFGPKFLVEIEVIMPKTTLLFESHDVGMELQYEIESREEVERCFVHIDYQSRPYDEHVVSKVPELREKYRPKKQRSTLSL